VSAADWQACRDTLVAHHYMHSAPAYSTLYYRFEDCIAAFSPPSSPVLSRDMFGANGVLWELTRLWAPDGHRPSLLTEALAHVVREFRRDKPAMVALVSYADLARGHTGGVYRAASWTPAGGGGLVQYWEHGVTGDVYATRKFRLGKAWLRADEIRALGYSRIMLPGKLRFLKGLTPAARRRIALKYGP
jgi:hypothetical protein